MKGEIGDLVKLEDKNKEIAFQSYQKLQELIKAQGFLFLEIGKLLVEIRDKQHYHFFGEGYGNWADFLSSGELPLKKSTVYAYISVYEIYINHYQFKPEDLVDIPWDKLRLVLPKVKELESKKEVEEWVEKTRVLSRSDLIMEMGEVQDDRGVPITKMAKLYLHRDCGKYILDFSPQELCNCK